MPPNDNCAIVNTNMFFLSLKVKMVQPTPLIVCVAALQLSTLSCYSAENVYCVTPTQPTDTSCSLCPCNSTTLLKPSPVSERLAYPQQSYLCFSPLTYSLESLGHKSTPSNRRPTVQKWVGPRMPEGQLSRVPWPENSWIQFTFQAALWALQ